MFKARTSRTLLTILGMGVGISAILFLVSLGYGIQQALLKTITTTDSLLSLDVYPGKDSSGLIKKEDMETMNSMPEISKVSPVFQTKAQIGFEGTFAEASAFIVDASFFDLNGTKLLGGAMLSEQGDNEIVITPTFAKIFQKTPEEMIGQTINFSLAVPEDENDLKNTKTVPMEGDFKIAGFVDDKNSALFLDDKSLSDAFPLPGYTQIKIRCSNNNSMATVRGKLIAQGFVVSSLSDIIDQANKIFAAVRIVLAFFGAIALMVSAIGMFNTMTVALMERTEEIGIMKSIGAYNSNILWMFVFESMLMGFLGGISGIVLGVSEGAVFNFLISAISRYFGGPGLDIFYTPSWLVFSILISGTVVGFLTGIIPAKRASSIDPLDALRYK